MNRKLNFAKRVGTFVSLIALLTTVVATGTVSAHTDWADEPDLQLPFEAETNHVEITIEDSDGIFQNKVTLNKVKNPTVNAWFDLTEVTLPLLDAKVDGCPAAADVNTFINFKVESGGYLESLVEYDVVKRTRSSDGSELTTVDHKTEQLLNPQQHPAPQSKTYKMGICIY